MQNKDSIASRLRARLSDLQARSDAAEQDLRRPLEADSAEQAVDLEDDEVLAGVDAMLGAEIVATQEALHRIEAGAYGICVRCGGEIAEQRLEALPATAFCIRCA